MTRRLLAPLILVCALTALLLSACSAAGGSSQLDGTNWRFTEWSISSIDPASVTITANFKDGQIGGSAPINSYSGPYEATRSGSFLVGPINSTLMGGSEEAMRAERAYFALLDQARTYSRKGSELTLSDANGNPLLIFASTK